MPSDEYYFMINRNPLRTSDPAEIDLDTLIALNYGFDPTSDILFNSYKIKILKDQEEPCSFLPDSDLRISYDRSGSCFVNQNKINFYKISPNDEFNPYVITAELHGKIIFSFYKFII